jgi:Ca-activated chloride channel family protein
MALLWPGFVLLLGLIPLLAAVYIWTLRRRRCLAVRYSSLSLVREALPHQSRLRRHLPFALFLLALTSLIFALLRPVAIVSVPTGQAVVMLAIDVSRSMCSRDVQPNRMIAAEDAALSFVQRQKAATQIGIVAFSTLAELVQPPTTDQEVLQDAIQNLAVGTSTAMGSAILKSLDAIAEVDKNVAPSVSDTASGNEPPPVPKGTYAPHFIVLLTDGASSTGPLPLDAAQQAADRGVRVYTIGFGTANGGDFIYCDLRFRGSEQLGGNGQSGGGQFSGLRSGVDEGTLKKIADMTGGTYYSAESAGELQNVFQNLPTYLIAKRETTEISVAFAAVGALLAATAILLALAWNPLP